jgi:protease-4
VRRTLAALLAIASALGCDGRPRSAALDGTPEDTTETEADDESGDGVLLEFDLRRGVPESTDGDRLFSLPAARTYTGLVRAIERAHHDEDATGYFIRLGTTNLDLSRSAEIGRLFASLRKDTGKPALCHAHTLENASTWLAAQACDEIWLSPAGEATTVGLGGQSFYLKSALQKLKIKAEFLSMGRYKSAVETFTRDGSSEDARIALDAVLKDIRAAWLDGTVAGRAGHDVASALELGPWDATESMKKGLVDRVGFESEALGAAKSESAAGKVQTAFGRGKKSGGLDISEIVRIIAGAEPSTSKPHIAVVPAEGSITMSSGGLLSEGGITPTALGKVLRRLAEDDAVKAVVLRIDSPGGSPLASDLIWHDMMELRKKKPVVASVGEMAASGGYYIACAASRVVAERTSIVGSIGVFGGKVVVDETLAEVGVHAETHAPSPDPVAQRRAAYLSPLVPWDDETRSRVRAHMKSVYDLFLDRVATGRKLGLQAVKKVAEGRIWTGGQGLERGLVDELGGLGKALEIARTEAHLDEDAPVRVEGAAETLLETLLLGEGADQSEVRLALERLAARRARVVGKVVAPLRPFVGSLQGLLDGEAVAVALPVAIVVR